MADKSADTDETPAAAGGSPAAVPPATVKRILEEAETAGEALKRLGAASPGTPPAQILAALEAHAAALREKAAALGEEAAAVERLAAVLRELMRRAAGTAAEDSRPPARDVD